MGVEQLLFDALYCEEQEESGVTFSFNDAASDEVLPMLEQDLMWDDEELQTLFSKQKESFVGTVVSGSDLSLRRKEAVEWVLKINSHYGFSASTAILAVNYLDRFLSNLSFQKDKPWMMQLTAVACLSLAAKVEETYVPLLLDLQVEGAKYLFEAKTIQRMELMILSALKWRMNSVTPLSFIDHSMRRLGFNTNIHWEFLRRCENLLLLIISDSRFRWYSPSVLAGASMIHVSGKGVDDYEVQLLSILKISQEEVSQCYNFLTDILSNAYPVNDALKRKNGEDNDDESSISSGSPRDSIHRPIYKKPRVQEQQMRRRLFAIGSPH